VSFLPLRFICVSGEVLFVAGSWNGKVEKAGLFRKPNTYQNSGVALKGLLASDAACRSSTIVVCRSPTPEMAVQLRPSCPTGRRFDGASVSDSCR
jgi:hypothetical protein